MLLLIIIRPESLPEEVKYFPILFGIGSNITASGGSLTFENVQIIELDPNRDPSTNPITIKGGFLTLNVYNFFVKLGFNLVKENFGCEYYLS